MNNDREILEALLAGKILINNTCGEEIRLIDNIISVLVSKEQTRIGNQQRDTALALLRFSDDWTIKQEVILINGVEVPAPEKVILKEGTTYYMPDLYVGFAGFAGSVWDAYQVDIHRLNSGIIHLTKEAAITHAEALLSFTKPEKQGV